MKQRPRISEMAPRLNLHSIFLRRLPFFTNVVKFGQFIVF